MSAAIAEQLAVLLGDDVDRSRYVWRNGTRLTQYPPSRRWCDSSKERNPS